MTSFFLDDTPNKNGVRTVRSAFCPDLPDFYGRIYLGEYDRIDPAVKKGLTFHKRVAECAGCGAASPARYTCDPVKVAS